ncbi:uncharacterized protein [Dipodomys merriami]|uniref:uncharacterized protein n=1 Tax=Dipodomys merriami TaxID=94247 RepID=UPI0038557675
MAGGRTATVPGASGTRVTHRRVYLSTSPGLPACHVGTDFRRARHVRCSRARARPPPSSEPSRPRTRARAPQPHVGAPPPPPPHNPPPPRRTAPHPGPRDKRFPPCFPLPLSFPPPPAPAPRHVPRTARSPFARGPNATGHSGRRRRRGRSPPPLQPWPECPPPQEAPQRRRGASSLGACCVLQPDALVSRCSPSKDGPFPEVTVGGCPNRSLQAEEHTSTSVLFTLPTLNFKPGAGGSPLTS